HTRFSRDWSSDVCSSDLTLRRSTWFDPDWYLGQYRDVAESGMDPVIHYLDHGASEGRDPGPGFSTSYYLEVNRDVADAGMNPLRSEERRVGRERRTKWSA